MKPTLKNGSTYLDSLAKDGDDFCYDVQYFDSFNIEHYSSDGVDGEFRFTDEVIYSCDVWTIKTVYDNV